MSQDQIGTLPGSTTDGAALLAALRAFSASHEEGFLGATRPSWIKKGGVWTRLNGDSSVSLCVFDGSTDLVIAQLASLGALATLNSVATGKLDDAAVTTPKLATDEQMTTDNVTAKTAGAGVDTVGTYAFLAANGLTLNPGAEVDATSLYYASVTDNPFDTNGQQVTPGTQPTGSWRCMGYLRPYAGQGYWAATLFLKISD
jgi:hypothetical protein